MLLALQLVGVAAEPLKVTVLVLCVAPKFAPLMVTEVPTAPEEGFKLEMLGVVEATVKVTPLLAVPPTVTTTAPVVAPEGTGTAMLVALQPVGVAVVPLNVTLLVLCVAPKLAPLMVTEVPTVPEEGFKPEIVGAGEVTLKNTPLLAPPPTVTTTLPEVAPKGTGTAILVALQLVGVAIVPLKLTVLVLCVAPKFVPVMVTGVPTLPEGGVTLVILGVGPPLLPVDGLKVATWTVQPAAAKPHVAATDPALVWIWYSVSSPDPVPAEVSVLSKLKPLPAFGL
jgi:hypothetical protein